MAATDTHPQTTAGGSSVGQTAPNADAQDVVRLSINLAPDVAHVLKSLAKSKRINVTEAVRRAIAVWNFLENEHAKGNKIAVVENVGGTARLREVVIL